MLKAGPAACWLWVCGLAHCQSQLTDGFISIDVLPMIGVTGGARARRLADTLVGVGLFEHADGGYQIHDYLAFNDTREEALAKKESDREQRRAAGVASGAARRGTSNGNGADERALNGAVQQPPLNPIPSHPIPSTHPPSRRVLGSPDRDDHARTFIERYPGIYAKAKHNASFRVREARDFGTVCEIVDQWPDPDFLSKMLELFLRDKQFAPMNQPGTPAQFAAKASECDAILRANGIVPATVGV